MVSAVRRIGVGLWSGQDGDPRDAVVLAVAAEEGVGPQATPGIGMTGAGARARSRSLSAPRSRR